MFTINYFVLYTMLPGPSVSKFVTWPHLLARVPISIFVPVFRRERHLPKMCHGGPLIVISGVPATYALDQKVIPHVEST